eukprot:Nk52_evm15s349 gene=Nk52_evmTU15s349
MFKLQALFLLAFVFTLALLAACNADQRLSREPEVAQHRTLLNDLSGAWEENVSNDKERRFLPAFDYIKDLASKVYNSVFKFVTYVTDKIEKLHYDKIGCGSLTFNATKQGYIAYTQKCSAIHEGRTIPGFLKGIYSTVTDIPITCFECNYYQARVGPFCYERDVVKTTSHGSTIIGQVGGVSLFDLMDYVRSVNKTLQSAGATEIANRVSKVDFSDGMGDKRDGNDYLGEVFLYEMYALDRWGSCMYKAALKSFGVKFDSDKKRRGLFRAARSVPTTGVSSKIYTDTDEETVFSSEDDKSIWDEVTSYIGDLNKHIYDVMSNAAGAVSKLWKKVKTKFVTSVSKPLSKCVVSVYRKFLDIKLVQDVILCTEDYKTVSSCRYGYLPTGLKKSENGTLVKGSLYPDRAFVTDVEGCVGKITMGQGFIDAVYEEEYVREIIEWVTEQAAEMIWFLSHTVRNNVQKYNDKIDELNNLIENPSGVCHYESSSGCELTRPSGWWSDCIAHPAEQLKEIAVDCNILRLKKVVKEKQRDFYSMLDILDVASDYVLQTNSGKCTIREGKGASKADETIPKWRFSCWVISLFVDSNPETGVIDGSARFWKFVSSVMSKLITSGVDFVVDFDAAGACQVNGMITYLYTTSDPKLYNVAINMASVSSEALVSGVGIGLLRMIGRDKNGAVEDATLRRRRDGQGKEMGEKVLEKLAFLNAETGHKTAPESAEELKKPMITKDDTVLAQQVNEKAQETMASRRGTRSFHQILQRRGAISRVFGGSDDETESNSGGNETNNNNGGKETDQIIGPQTFIDKIKSFFSGDAFAIFTVIFEKTFELAQEAIDKDPN